MSKNKIGAVIVAAGESSVPVVPMLKREIDTLHDAGITPVAVVTGADGETVTKGLVHRKVIFVRNDRYRTTGMLDSVVLGIESIEKSCSKIFIINAYNPVFSSDTIEKILEHSGEIVLPRFEGKEGHPCCIDVSCVEKLKKYKGKNGIQGMIAAGILSPAYVDVDDPGIHLKTKSKDGFDKAESFRRKQIAGSALRCNVKVSLERKETFFDEDLARLLHETDRTGSMNKACKNLEMAYSSGWKKVKNAEEQLGFPLIRKTVGGSRGGGSGLTDEGRIFLGNYQKLEKKIKKYAERCFKDTFQE